MFATVLTVLLVSGFLALAGWWLITKCCRQVGSVKMPAQAVKLRFGRAVAGLGPGLHFVLHPFEKLRIFPTFLYMLQYAALTVYTKKEGDCRTVLATNKIAIHLRWPRVGKTYSFQGKDVSGEELLMETHEALGFDPAKPNGELEKLLGQTVADGMRQVFVNRTHVQIREEKVEIEEELKRYFLSEPGNPFRELHIPRDCIDVGITQISFPQTLEDAFSAPEIAAREKEAIISRLEAFKEGGVDSDVAGILVVGFKKGEELDLSVLRDWTIFRAMLPKS